MRYSCHSAFRTSLLNERGSFFRFTLLSTFVSPNCSLHWKLSVWKEKRDKAKIPRQRETNRGRWRVIESPSCFAAAAVRTILAGTSSRRKKPRQRRNGRSIAARRADEQRRRHTCSRVCQLGMFVRVAPRRRRDSTNVSSFVSASTLRHLVFR